MQMPIRHIGYLFGGMAGLQDTVNGNFVFCVVTAKNTLPLMEKNTEESRVYVTMGCSNVVKQILAWWRACAIKCL